MKRYKKGQGRPTARKSTAPRSAQQARSKKPSAAPPPPALEPMADREAWLLAAAEHLLLWVREEQQRLGIPIRGKLPPAISIGYPLSRAPEILSGHIVDGRTRQMHIYLSPELGTGCHASVYSPHSPQIYSPHVRILDVLLHELVHHALESQSHSGHFRQLAHAMGLEGPMADSYASHTLRRRLGELIEHHIGQCPHRALRRDPTLSISGNKKQRSRQRKYVCSLCGQIIRAGSTHLQALHLCTDGKQGTFVLDES